VTIWLELSRSTSSNSEMNVRWSSGSSSSENLIKQACRFEALAFVVRHETGHGNIGHQAVERVFGLGRDADLARDRETAFIDHFHELHGGFGIG
jgi:hypothetical protein